MRSRKTQVGELLSTEICLEATLQRCSAVAVMPAERAGQQQKTQETIQVLGHHQTWKVATVEKVIGSPPAIAAVDLPESIRQDMERYAQKAQQAATSTSQAAQREVLHHPLLPFLMLF